MRQGGLILAVCRVRSKKKNRRKKGRKKNPPRPKTHHETHISPATATTSRRRAKTHVPRVSPYSPASIDTGFVEIGLVQLSQSVKTTNSMLHTRTHRQTSFTSREVHEVRWPRTCSRPCAFEGKKANKKKKNPHHPKHITKSIAARRPRPTRDGARRNTSHALARTRLLS